MSAFYDYNDIVNALKNVNILKDDIVYLSTNLGVVGTPPKEIKNIDDLCSLFYSAILEVIGENGLLLVPGFTYTFGNSLSTEPSTFDIHNSKPTIGSFPNFILKNGFTIRTPDPMLSVFCVGKKFKTLFKHLKQTTYGEGGFFSFLVKSKAKLLNIGIRDNWMPFIHHVDWLVKSPHRFDKVFNGIIKEDCLINCCWLYTVRILSDISYPYADRVGKIALDKSIWKTFPLGRIKIYSCSCKEYFDLAIQEAKKDPWILAKGPESDVYEIELQRTSKEKVDVESTLSSDIEQFSQKTRRDVTGDSIALFLEIIKKYYVDIKIFDVNSGTHAFSHIVPERWVLKDFVLTDINGKDILNNDGIMNRIGAFSMSIDSTISQSVLFKHLKVSYYGIHNVDLKNNRDWIISVNMTEINKLDHDSFKIKIDSDFSFGKLFWGEKVLNSNSDKYIAFVSYIDGPYRLDENISGVMASIELFKYISQLKQRKYNYIFAFVPSEIGFCSWLLNNKPIWRKIEAIFHLKFLSNNLPFTILTDNRKYVHSHLNLFSCLETNEKFYGLGNNPILERIHYPNVNNILIQRSEQPFSIHYPHISYNSHLDNKTDKNSLKESINFLINKIIRLKEGA